MKLFEEYKLYEGLWDDIERKNKTTIRTARSNAKASKKHIRKPINEAVSAGYDEKEVKACLNRVANAAKTNAPDFDGTYGEGMIFVSVSEELLKKALRIGNRGTYQDGAAQAVTVPAHAVDDMVLCFNFEEDDEVALVSLMLGGEDEAYYDDICVVGWGDHIAGLSDIKDMKSAKTFFETQLVPNANKIAEDIINNSWAHYKLSDYAGITTQAAANPDTDDWDKLVVQADNFLSAIIKATGNENYDDGDGYWSGDDEWCNRYMYYANSVANLAQVEELCKKLSTDNCNFYVSEDDTEEDPVSEIGYTLTKAAITESGCKGAGCKKKDLKESSGLTGYRVVLADYDTDDFDINVEFGMQDPDEYEVADYEYLLKPGQTKGDLVVWLSRDCGYTSIYVHDERPAATNDIKRLASDTFPVTGTGDAWQDYGTLDESLTEDVVDPSNSIFPGGISHSREVIIHDLAQEAAVRKGRVIGTGEEELYDWLKKEDYYLVEFSAWRQSTAYSFEDFPQHLANSSTSISKRDGIECFVGTLPEVTEVLNDVVAKSYEFEFITVSKLLITLAPKKFGKHSYNIVGIDENADEVFLLSFFDSEEGDTKEYQAPTIRFNKIFSEQEPFIRAIKNVPGYGIIVEAANLGSKQRV